MLHYAGIRTPTLRLALFLPWPRPCRDCLVRYAQLVDSEEGGQLPGGKETLAGDPGKSNLRSIVGEGARIHDVSIKNA